MWRSVRIAILMLVLAIAAFSTWHDRASTRSWERTLTIGIFPIDADGTAAGATYIGALTPESVADIETFLTREARRYGITIDRPVRVELFPAVRELPPPRTSDGVLSNAWWSLKLRRYAARNSHPEGRAAPKIRIFVLYHDPSFAKSVPHSVGLQKGLVGVVHAFADPGMTRANNVVIAHELLHTLGASDKYDFATLAPLWPIGYAEPEREPRLPQTLAEIMAGRFAVDEHTFRMPDSLDDVRVGPATALEIGWRTP